MPSLLNYLLLLCCNSTASKALQNQNKTFDVHEVKLQKYTYIQYSLEAAFHFLFARSLFPRTLVSHNSLKELSHSYRKPWNL